MKFGVEYKNKENGALFAFRINNKQRKLKKNVLLQCCSKEIRLALISEVSARWRSSTLQCSCANVFGYKSPPTLFSKDEENCRAVKVIRLDSFIYLCMRLFENYVFLVQVQSVSPRKGIS